MIDHIWTVVCSKSLIDQATNNLSMVEVIETLNVGPIPPDAPEPWVVPVQFDVVSLWVRRDPGRGARMDGRIVMLGPNGRELHVSNFVVDLTNVQRARTVGRYNGLPIVGFGTQVVRIETLDETTGEHIERGRVPIEIARLQA